MFIDTHLLIVIICALCAGVAWLMLFCYDRGWHTGFSCCERITKVSRELARDKAWIENYASVSWFNRYAAAKLLAALRKENA